MREELLKSAQDAVRIARDAGADEVRASARRSREVEYSYRDGNLETVKDATSRAVSLDLYVDGRYSRHSSNDLRPEQLQSFVAEAVQIARALQPDPHRTITDPALYEGVSDVDLDIVDADLPSLTRDERLALCTAQYEVIAGADRLISATCGVQDGHVLIAGATSNGFSGVHEETYLWLGSEVTLRGDGDARAESWMWGGASHREDAPDAESVARLALERTQARIGSKKGPTVSGPMIVDPSVASSLIYRLLGPATAASVQQGQSFFAGKVGEKLVSEKVTITDEPLLVRGLSSRKFDPEGIASRPLPVIEAGVLRNLYVDTYYGHKLELAPTTGSPSNRVLALGDKDLAALLAEVGEGIYVTSWLGGNADRTTGDFSFGLRGHLVKGGEIGAPVGEMNITGNLLDLFSNLVALGSDPWPYSSTRAPTLVFDGVSFSGA